MSEIPSLILFDSPIGYFKNPGVANSGNFKGYNGPLLSEENICHKQFYNKPPKDFTLDKLPFEIRQKIANNLWQFDCLNLMRVSRALYLSTLPRLYQNIVIDQNFSQFNKEIEFWELKDGQDFAKTFIIGATSFEKFLITYFKICSKIPQHDIPYVKSFKCLDMPDSINIHDHTFSKEMANFFLSTPYLHTLVWLNEGFKLEYLSYLPQPEALEMIDLHLFFEAFPEEKSSNTRSIQNRTDIFEFVPKKFNCPRLRCFLISPYITTENMMKASNFFLSFDKKNNLITENLNSLDIAAYNHDYILSTFPWSGLVGSQNQTLSQYQNQQIINKMFRSPRKFYNLTSLLISEILVLPAEAESLINSVNLENLTSLQLKGVSEFQNVPFGEAIIPENLQDSFILQICPYLKKLKKLHLDFRESFADSVPTFLSSIPSDELTCLDLVIRYNPSKLEIYDNENDFYHEYALAIVSKSSRKSSLSQLAIEIIIANQMLENTAKFPLPFVFYGYLEQLQKLKALRVIPPRLGKLTLNPSDASSSFLKMIRNLKNLKILDVFGTHAGGAPHMGLTVAYPNILDEWYKVQHVAILYRSANPNIKYIRINKCIFEISQDVTPRDGINKWFDSRVRVGRTF